MAVSGTYDFNLDIDQVIQEASEMIGGENTLGHEPESARRSINLMLKDWQNRGVLLWSTSTTAVTVVASTTSYSLDSSTINALEVVIGRSDTDVKLTRITPEEFMLIPNKTQTGKPNQYFVNKQITPTISVWPAPDKSSTYTVVMNVLTRMDDSDSATNTMEVPFRFYPCLTAGLAYYISMKRAPERTAMLKSMYEEEFTRALSQDEDRASFRISPDIRSYNNA